MIVYDTPSVPLTDLYFPFYSVPQYNNENINETLFNNSLS